MEECQDVEATLKFLQWQPLYETEKPFQIFIDIPDDAEDKRNTNLVFEDVQLTVQDVRSMEEIPSIDEKGFIYRKHNSCVSSFGDREVVDKTYLPEVEALLKAELDGVDRVFFFDWRVSMCLRGFHCGIVVNSCVT
jgi:hypothetical protein